MENKNSVNQSQTLDGVTTENLAAEADGVAGLVPCPHCQGKGEGMALVCGTRCDFRAMKCYTCAGVGSITLEHVRRMESAEVIREDRIKRRLTLREEAKRLGVDFPEWSRIEAGRLPETDAGRRALEVRCRELQPAMNGHDAFVAEAAALKAERDNAHSEAIAELDAQVEALCSAWRGDIRAHQDQCPATFSNCVPDDCGCGLTEKREAEMKKIKETAHITDLGL